VVLWPRKGERLGGTGGRRYFRLGCFQPSMFTFKDYWLGISPILFADSCHSDMKSSVSILRSSVYDYRLRCYTYGVASFCRRSMRRRESDDAKVTLKKAIAEGGTDVKDFSTSDGHWTERAFPSSATVQKCGELRGLTLSLMVNR